MTNETRHLIDEQVKIYEYLKTKGFENYSACGDIVLAVAIRRIQQSIDKLKSAIEKK